MTYSVMILKLLGTEQIDLEMKSYIGIRQVLGSNLCWHIICPD